MDFAYHVENPRQRVADYSAVLVLTRAAAEDVDVSVARLGGIVAAFLPTMESAKLRAWSEMDMAQAVRAIKIDLLRHEIARAEACTRSLPMGRKARRSDRAARAPRSGQARMPARTQGKLSEQDIGRLDEEISRSVVASFFRFMTMSALDPNWFAPYLAEAPAF